MHEFVNLAKAILIISTIFGLLGVWILFNHKKIQQSLNIFFVMLAVISVWAYANFGTFHQPYGYVHNWEMFHYYLASKYAPELGYDSLYGPALVADAESPQPYFTSIQKVRDLRTSTVVPAEQLRQDYASHQGFTSTRWQEFRQDVDYIKVRYNPEVWQRVFVDHGYNAPPTRTVVTTFIANQLGPASNFSIYLIAFLDPFLLLILLAAVYRAYGLRIAALIAILFGTNMLSAFYWIGGSFLRFDWLVMSGLGIVALKGQRYGWAGALFGVAAGLRIFPVFFALGIVLQGFQKLLSDKTWDQKYTKFLLSFCAAGAILLILSLIYAGGFEVWQDFYAKIQTLLAPLHLNHIGLRYLLDSWPTLFWLAQVAIFGLYYHSLRKTDGAQAAILGGVLIFTFGFIASYYYSFLILFLLWQKGGKLDLSAWLFYSLLFLTSGVVIAFQMLDDYSSQLYHSVSLTLLVAFTVLFIRIHRTPQISKSSKI